LSPGQVASLMRKREWKIPDKMRRYNKFADKMSQIRRGSGENSKITSLAREALLRR